MLGHDPCLGRQREVWIGICCDFTVFQASQKGGSDLVHDGLIDLYETDQYFDEV